MAFLKLLTNLIGKLFNKNFLDSKHILKVHFKPGRKNIDFEFLPLPTLPVSVKNGHLNQDFSVQLLVIEKSAKNG